MQSYEYKVVPAPARGDKARGLKTPVERFAATLATVMNDLARDGWDYVRADTLPSEERSGLTKRTTVYHSVLVFRRALAAAPAPALAAPAADEAPRRLLTTEAPAGKAPALQVEPVGAAPKLGGARPESKPEATESA